MKELITEENLHEFEKILNKGENVPISENRREHARIVVKLINEAYFKGYQKGVSEAATRK